MRRKALAVAGGFCLGLALNACGSEENNNERSDTLGQEEAMAQFEIAGHSHRLPISCFVGSRQMAVSAEDATGEDYSLPEGMSSLSVSADLSDDRNQIVVMAMSDSDNPRHLYHWVVRDGDQPLGEFKTLAVDREARTIHAEAIFHNQAYDSDHALFRRGEEREGRVEINC